MADMLQAMEQGIREMVAGPRKRIAGHSLTEYTKQKLQDLILANLDVAKIYQDAAGTMENPRIARVLRVWARERTDQAERLSRWLPAEAVPGERRDSWLQRFHRTASQNGTSAHLFLTKAAIGEDFLKRLYEETLVDCASSPVNDELQQQYAQTKAVKFNMRRLWKEHSA